MEDFLLISGIQHFSFCRRQWALIHIENQWNENGLTAEGRVMHNRVHDAQLVSNRNNVITIRGIPVSSERLKITGQCDAVELIPDAEGIELRNRKGRWRIHPVEYKRGRSKVEDCDRLQLAAQCVCLEEMLCYSIRSASLFYGESRRREEVDISEELRTELLELLTEMRGYYDRKFTPRVRPSKICNSCSLINICLPKLMDKKDVGSYIKRHMRDDFI